VGDALARLVDIHEFKLLAKCGSVLPVRAESIVCARTKPADSGHNLWSGPISIYTAALVLYLAARLLLNCRGMIFTQ